MKGKTKLFAILLVLALLTAIAAGCGQPTTSAPPSEEVTGFRGTPDQSYYMIQFVTGVEYWFPVYAMFKHAAMQLGVQAHYVETIEYDAQRQLDVFEQILAMNPTGILFCPINPDIFVEPINRAIAQGVAIVTYATDSPDSNRHAFITSDNVFEGQFAARKLAEEIGYSGKLMTLCNPGQLNHDIRVEVFIKTIEDEFPNIELVANLPSNQDVEVAYTHVMTVAQMHPDLAGVFMPEANSGMGAARASQELGGKIRVLCTDVNDAILDMIKAGQIWGAINPDQGMQGYWGMLLTFVSANPQLIEPMNHRKAFGENPLFIPFMDNGLNIVTAETADYYYIDNYLKVLGVGSVDELLSSYIP